MDVYVNNTVSAGAYHDLFYTNPQIRTYYQNYIQAVVSRYVNSPAIFAWELANEGSQTLPGIAVIMPANKSDQARCSGSGANPQSLDACNTDVVTRWVSDVSSFIKSIDSHHMVRPFE